MSQNIPANSPPEYLERILKRLRQARRVAVFTHQRPDPDALGSQAAAAVILKHLGAQQVFLPQFADPPLPYRFLLQDLPADIVPWSPDWANSAALDTLLLVDTCTFQQLEPATEFLKSAFDRTIAIDHHASRDNIGPPDHLFTDTHAAACVEILWQLSRLAEVPMDARLARPLLAGLVGDTGWFRFDSVNVRTHLIASELVARVNPAALYERLMQNEAKPKLSLMQRALSSIQWSFADRYACMVLTQSDFTQTGASLSQTEYLVDMPMAVSTVEVVALLTELPDRRIRVSLRSKHDVDVNHICNKFGGGGHAKAAGCRFDVPLNEAIMQLESAVGGALSS